jgi:nonsense-mediated mRNA decay protein 3
LIHGLCEACFWEDALDDFPRLILLTMCSSCFCHLQGKRWVRRKGDANEEKVIEGAKEELLKTSDLAENLEIRDVNGSITEWFKSGRPKTVELEAEVQEKSSGLSRKAKTSVNIEYRLCHDCYCVASGKYDTLVQIRADGRKLDGEDKKILETIFERFYRRTEGRGRSDVTDVKDHEGGVDVKFLTMNMARMFVRELSDATGATLFESARIMGLDRSTGGTHYRTTIAVKLPIFRAGELIEGEGTLYQIMGYHRGRAVVEALKERGRKRSLSRDQLDASRRVDFSEYKRVRLDSKTKVVGTFFDLEEKKFFELPSGIVPRDMNEGDVGIMVTIDGKENIFKTGEKSYQKNEGQLY